MSDNVRLGTPDPAAELAASYDVAGVQFQRMAPEIRDSVGNLFNPDACSHAYAYTDGLLTTDTATAIGGTVRVKTFTYTSGALTAESTWVPA